MIHEHHYKLSSLLLISHAHEIFTFLKPHSLITVSGVELRPINGSIRLCLSRVKINLNWSNQLKLSYLI